MLVPWMVSCNKTQHYVVITVQKNINKRLCFLQLWYRYKIQIDRLQKDTKKRFLCEE